MRKFILLIALLFAIGSILTACGDEETGGNSDQETETTDGESNEEENALEEAATDENEEPTEAEENKKEDVNETAAEATEDEWDTEVGETIENEGGTFTLHKRQDDIETIETGPVILEIEQINAISGELENELAEMMDSDTLDYIQVDLNLENTSDEDIIFYSGQATMATNTGEQLENDMWLSDHIDGEMMAGVSGSGSFFYVLENSNAEDVESVRLVWSAPTDEDWTDIGDEVDIEIEF